MTTTRRDPRLIAFAALAVLTIVGGLALGFLGVGAQLAEERDVRLTLLVTEIPPEVAQKVQVGDPVFTDPGGMRIGEIVEVEAGPDLLDVPDAEGNIYAREHPILWRVRAVVEAPGRMSDEIVAIDNEVVQAGQFFALISKSYYLHGMVIDVDVD